MARTTPPGIDPVPTPPIQRGDRATFSSRVDAFILWLVNAVTQFRAVALNVYDNAVDAFQSATGAATSATNAGTSATNAANSATAAGTSATNAAGSATAAGNSATAAATSASNAANSATALTATSTTSNTLGTGSKTFTIQSGKQFVAGVRLLIVNPSNAAQFMSGTVTSYAGTSLVVAVEAFEGTGTLTNWNISVSGQRGIQGATGASAVPRMNVVVLTTGQAWTVAAADFEVELCGGGQSGQDSRSPGGACGAYAKKIFKGATIGAAAAVSVGAGGTAATNGVPNSGGASSFSLAGFTTVSAQGGSNTNAVASGGDININGNKGTQAAPYNVVITQTTVLAPQRAGRGADGMLGNGSPTFGVATGFGSGGSGRDDTINGESIDTSNVTSAGAPGVCIIRYLTQA